MSYIVPERPPRTLILCFDGTADSFDKDTTNVVRLFSAFEKERPDRQLCYYQPGIDIIREGTTNTPLTRNVSRTDDHLVSDVAGGGKDDGSSIGMIMGGYRFLMQHYMKGDQICMFGFSRGAYTARCLAGMLNKIGLLTPSNEEQIAFAYKHYINTDKGNEKDAKVFKETFSVNVEIAFVGVWDTVASCGLFGRHLPFTAQNQIIRHFRHALALDERRGKFKPNQWHRKSHSVKGAENDPNAATTVVPPLTNAPRRKETVNDWVQAARDRYRRFTKMQTVWSDDTEAFDSKMKNDECDVREVWFPGCHADVGGGSVDNDTPHCLANASLAWMVNQLLATRVRVIFKQDAFESHPGLNPEFGGEPGVPLRKTAGFKDKDSMARLDTVEEDNEKSESFDDDAVETTGVAYSASSPTVTLTAPPPTSKTTDPAASTPPSPIDRQRLSLRWLQRRRQLDVVIPQRAASLSSPRSPSYQIPSSPISPLIASMENGTIPTAGRLPTPSIIEPQSRSSETTVFGGNDAANNDNYFGGEGPLSYLGQKDATQDARSRMVDQLDETKLWWILEYMPLWQHYQDREGYWHKGFHFNRGRVRRILDPGAVFHSSVRLRRGYVPESTDGKLKRTLKAWFHVSERPGYTPGAQLQEGSPKYDDELDD
ncbi:hypothetical protein FS837_007592 [Tulasnella sp. UAMH 9824]|nr:hypothetical protein FS837_007592 [Tulasnella sp. UAMH 9824]